MISILGISYKTAPVSIRGKFSFDSDDIIQFVTILKNDNRCKGVVVLSTCNRTEIYLNSAFTNENTALSFITSNLFEFKKCDSSVQSYFYFKTDADAVRHLFEVAAGIDSLVLGEDQVIGQVKEAFRFSQEKKTIDCVLTRLFIKAIEAGKRVRSETLINKGAASVSYASVELCSEIYSDLQSCVFMLIGLGQTGELTLQSLLKKGNPKIYITNRTFSKAVEKSEKYNATPVEFNNFETHLPECDIVIIATGSKEHIITKQIAENAMKQRNYKKQIYIDLSVPANVSEEVKEIDNTFKYGVDDLEAVINKNAERRKYALDDSNKIIDEVLTDFFDWMNNQNIAPTIKAIKENLFFIHKTELEAFKKFNKINNDELIEQYSQYISEKFAKVFIKNLKEITANGKNTEHIEVINNIFELLENEK